LEIVRQRAPEARIDGEFQADSALMPQVAAKKLKRPSAVAGGANVLIFPDLNSGNIGYKLIQYLAGARAIGPFLQGFAQCSVADYLHPLDPARTTVRAAQLAVHHVRSEGSLASKRACLSSMEFITSSSCCCSAITLLSRCRSRT
jgi:phosphotransacetylase